MNCHRHMTPVQRTATMFGTAVFGLVSAVVFGLIFGLFVQWLWNWLMPLLFHLPVITFWQGFGLIILARLIFGSFHMNGHHHSGQGYANHRRRDYPGGWDQQDWKVNGSWRNWDDYDDWWRAEGKAAFEEYIDRMHREPCAPDERNGDTP